MQFIRNNNNHLQPSHGAGTHMIKGAFCKGINLLCMIFFCAILFSCKKSAFENNTPPSGQLKSPHGNPTGTLVAKTIGTSGGSISSADGNMTVSIPTGALANNEVIQIQEVTNTLPGLSSKIYRVTPHNIQFQKPATITLTYNADSVRNSTPDLLSMAYQDSTGKWFFAPAPVVDSSAHTVTTTTTHFSDWGVLEFAYLTPTDPHIEPGSALILKVMCLVPASDIDIIPIGGGPVYQPYYMDSRYIGQWDYAGEGSLDPLGSVANYQAPSNLPKVNPEAVSVEILSKSKGKFYLVSNITINNGFQIDYMKVDERALHDYGQNYESRLFIYGKFGNDPGKGKRHVKINNTEVPVAFWGADRIGCDIPVSGPGSSGMVAVTAGNKSISKLLNEWTVYLQYAEQQSPNGALTKKARIALRLRGDANGTPPPLQPGDFSETKIHAQSNCLINVSAGKFTTHVTLDACGDYTVDWEPVNNLLLNRKPDLAKEDGLVGTVKTVNGGFDVKLNFKATDVLMTHRKYVGCTSGYSLDHVKETIILESFSNKAIPLRFNQSGSNATILSGALPAMAASPAAGLYWDRPDYPATAFTRTLTWSAAQAKY